MCLAAENEDRTLSVWWDLLWRCVEQNLAQFPGTKLGALRSLDKQKLHQICFGVCEVELEIDMWIWLTYTHECESPRFDIQAYLSTWGIVSLRLTMDFTLGYIASRASAGALSSTNNSAQ
jgi:hypothetical protein